MFNKHNIIIFLAGTAIFAFGFHFALAQGELVIDQRFCEYLRALFLFLISIAAFFSVAMIVFAGIKWIYSAGNPQEIGRAYNMIWSAVLGLILAFASYLILNSINPALVNFKGCGAVSGGAGGGLIQKQAQQLERTLPSAPERTISGQKVDLIKDRANVGLEGLPGEQITPEVAELMLAKGRETLGYAVNNQVLPGPLDQQNADLLDKINNWAEQGGAMPGAIQDASVQYLESLHESKSVLSSGTQQKLEQTTKAVKDNYGLNIGGVY